MKFIYIAIGGACGSVCRYILSEYVSTKYTTNFPLGTLLVNTIGSLIIGFLFGFFSINGEVNDRLKFLVFIGFLGGFTTFSSYALENMKHLQNNFFSTALLYILLSNFLGILLAYFGYILALKLK